MKTIVILGGLGYIGSHLVELLVNKNYNIKILDLKIFGDSHLSSVINENCIFRGDVRNSTDVASIIKGADIVVHLAGLVGDPACSIDEEQTWLYNTESSRIITDICNHYNVSQFIYASSCSVYGASPSNIILNEGSYLNPVSLYAKTKIDSEKVFFKSLKNNCTILRLATAFGYSRRMRFDLVANLFTIKAIKEKKIQVFGGTQYRPFINCYDAARAFLAVIENNDPKKVNREIFNVCSENITIKNLGNLICKLIPDCVMELVEEKEDDRNYSASSEKIEWLLKFTPKFKLKDGIKDLILNINKFKYEDWNTNDIYYNHKMRCFT